ncbi:MAG: leucine-rich repeat domain-containing protein, partial [Ureaplasma sp.]|nr:leucine-rich repeat domain-containing protein [Ureaplasma sp.]
FKYSVSSNNNVVVENGSLVVKNLTYYLDLTISDQNLQDLWTKINNFLLDNQVTGGDNGDIGGYLNYSIYNFFKNTETIDNGLLGQFINSPNDSYGGTIFVNLNNNRLYKMTSKILDGGNVNVSNNSTISIQNLPLEWKSGNFNWSSNAIRGFSSTGNSAVNNGSVNVIFPKRCESIGDSAFYSNTKIIKCDFSFSSIKTFGISAFNNCVNLSSVIFNNVVTSFDKASFAITAITSIKIPASVTQLSAWYAFGDLTNLREIYFLGSSLPNFTIFDNQYRPFWLRTTPAFRQKIYVKNQSMRSAFLNKNFQMFGSTTYTSSDVIIN